MIQSALTSDHLKPLDTVVYAAKGHGTVISKGGEESQDLEPGDFALIPGTFPDAFENN